MVYYAASHPEWTKPQARPAVPADAATAAQVPIPGPSCGTPPASARRDHADGRRRTRQPLSSHLYQAEERAQNDPWFHASTRRLLPVHATSNQGSADISFAAAPHLADVRCTSGNATVRVPTAGHRYHVVVSSGTGTAQSKVPDDRQSSSIVQVSSGNSATVLPAS